MNYLLAILSSIIYFILKYVEVKIINKKQFEYKPILRETLVVGLCVLLSDFLFVQFEPLNKNLFNTPNVFIDEPKF
jgi:hypothetical protein